MLTTDDKSISTLVSFGLTTLQAKIYLTLAKMDKAPVRILSENSKVARQDIYRIITELFDLGLIEKIISTPNEFRAIPIEEALSGLINRRNLETVQLQKEATNLLKNYFGNFPENKTEEEGAQFEVTTEKQAQLLRTRKAFEKAKNTILVVTKWSMLLQFAPLLLSKKSSVFSHNVNVRVITQKPVVEQPLPKQIQTLIEKSFFKIKFLKTSPNSIVLLFDDKEMAMAMSPMTEIDETPFLWSTNPGFIRLAQDYFDSMSRSTL
jgi:sugar-specific transcriptional regulator TrmB